jgi:transcriptional regulator with XRE-family HTH domain
VPALSCEDVGAVDKAEWQAFGEWVESLRKRSGLRVKELGERAGVSAQWLQELRHGGRAIYGEWRLPNPKDDALARLARALDVPVEEMFARAGRGAAPSDAEAETAESAPADRGDARALKRIRELETRITQYEKELAELRELVEGQQPRRARSH